MLRRLAKDSVIYGCSTLLVRGIQIVLIPVYSRVLGAGEYGIVETVAILGALVNLTVALEISQGMARYLADAPDESQRRSYASTAIAFSVLAYGLFVLLVVAASAPLSQWLLGGNAPAHTLLVAVGALAVNGVFVLVQDLLRWQLRPGAYLAAGLAYSLGSASVGIFLVAVQGMGVSGVFWGQLAGALLGGLVAVRGAAGLLAIEFDRSRLRRMLSYSLPLVISGAAVFGNLFAGQIVVRELLGIDALGVYGVAARFASVVSILTVGLQAALAPLVFRSWREPGTAPMLARVCRYYCVCMVPLVGGIALFSGEILLAVTGPAFHGGREVLPVLALAAMFSSLYVFAPGLFLGERTGHAAALNVGGALLNLALALWLVPRLGMGAAAITTTISAAIVFAGYVLLGRVYFRVPYQAIRVAASLGATGLLVALGLAWNAPPPAWDAAQLAIKLTVLLTAAAAAAAVGMDRDDRALITDNLCSFLSIKHKGNN